MRPSGVRSTMPSMTFSGMADNIGGVNAGETTLTRTPNYRLRAPTPWSCR